MPSCPGTVTLARPRRLASLAGNPVVLHLLHMTGNASLPAFETPPSTFYSSLFHETFFRVHSVAAGGSMSVCRMAVSAMLQTHAIV